MAPRNSWKELTALSLLLLPLLSATPAFAHRDGNMRISLPEHRAMRLNGDGGVRQSRENRNTGWHNSAGRNATPFDFANILNLPDANAAGAQQTAVACGCTGGGIHKSDLLPDKRLANNVRLDLSSEDKVIALPSKLFRSQSWVTVNVGGLSKTFAEGALVTPAEYVAVTQALGGDGQSLSLNTTGSASGGQFSLDLLRQPSAFRNITDLVIPENVVAVDDVARGALRLSGNIVNHGQILGTSNNHQHDGKIFADSVINLAGAVISMDTGVGTSATNTPGQADFVDNVGKFALGFGSKLLISAAEKVVNIGTIFSGGSLTVSAPEIRNKGLMLSGDCVYVETQKIVNTGIVKAMGALISVAGSVANPDSGLSINNMGGKFDVSNGNLVMSAGGPINVIGGALNAQLVKFNTPYSAVDVAVDSISGLVDVAALSSAVHVNSGDLAVNNINVSGDPIFTNSTGNIVLPANISASAAPVTAVAAGDIIGAAGSGTVIDTSSMDDDGGDVILLAGVANVTTNGTTTVSGASGLNGSIYGITSINASGADNGTGGNITLGAFGGSITVNGAITNSGKNGGHVTILSPGDINVGDVTSRGQHNREDYITIKTVNPTLGSGLTFNSVGKLQQGTIGAATTLGAGSIFAGNLESGVRNGSGANAGNINLLAGGSVSTGYLRAMGGGAAPKGWALQGWDYATNGGSGGNITVVSQTSGVTIDGDVNSSGGGGGGANHTVGGQGGDGGNVLITAIADVLFNGPVLAPGGGGGGGVGISSTDTAGGGGSLGNGGGPNSGGIFYAPPPYDGPANLDNGLNPHNPNHPRFPYAGMGGSNTAYDIGCCGSGYGGDVGEYGENGDQGTFAPRGNWNDTSPQVGGAPGIGGNITVSGRDITVTKTIEQFYVKKNIDRSPYAQYSIFTHSQRGGGSINLTTSSGTVSSTAYAANSDLESSSTNVTAQLRTGQVSLAGKMRGDQVTYNGNTLANIFNGGVLAGGGVGRLAITENGSSKTVTNGDQVTAAEWIALIQKASTGLQPLQLGASGTANGGSFSIANANLPVGGFLNLVIPVNVTSSVDTPNLSISSAYVKGHLQFTGDATLTTSTLTIAGDLSAPGKNLTINTPQLNLLNGSQLTAGGIAIQGTSGLNINVSNGGSGATINSTSGATIGLSGQAVGFTNTGGPATLKFTGGPVDMLASTFSNSNNTNLSFNSKTTVSLSGSQFLNQGVIAANDSAGDGGDFSILSSASTLNVTAGNLLLAPTAPGGGNGGTFAIAAGLAALSLINGTLDTSAAGAGNFDGGKISILANSLSVSGGSLALISNGVGTGSGGAVSVVTASSGSDLSVDGNTGHLSVTAHGGSGGGGGGSLTLSSGRDLIVSSSALNLGPSVSNGSGAHFDFEAGTGGSGKLSVTGSLNANGIGTGTGGSIRVASNSSVPMTIGTSTTNGVSGSVSADGGASGGAGGSIIVENQGSGGIKLNSSTSVSANATSGNGGVMRFLAANGLIDLPTGTYAVNGAGSNGKGGEISVSAGTLNIAGAAQFSATGSGSGQGDGGFIDVDIAQGQNLVLGSGLITLIATGGSSSGSGGRIAVSTGGDLTVQTGAINAKPLGINGDGARYTLASTTGNLLVNDSLDANAKGNGDGGAIDLSFGSAAPFVIGGAGLTNGVTGTLSAAGSGSGVDGAISITSNNQLGVNINSSVSAGTVKFQSQNDINVDVLGSLLGKIDASGKAFNILNHTGGISLGSVVTGLDGIVVTTQAGPITLYNSVTSTGSVGFNATGNVQLNGVVSAPGVSINTDSGDIVSNLIGTAIDTTNLSLTSSTGNIGSNANALSVVATNISANTGGSGAVHLASNGTAAITLQDSSAGADFVITANGPIDLNDITTGAGDISVSTAAGKLYVVPGSNILAVDGDITLRNDDISQGSIAIGANSSITASSTINGVGNVYIGFGAPASELPKPKKKYKQTEVLITNGGGVYVNKPGLVGSKPSNFLVADGRNIILQNASKKRKRAIALEGNVTITADPPSLQPVSMALSTPSAQAVLSIAANPVERSGAKVSHLPSVTSLKTAQPVSANLLQTPSVDATFTTAAVLPTDTMSKAMFVSTIAETSMIPSPASNAEISLWSDADVLNDQFASRVQLSMSANEVHMPSIGAVLFAPSVDKSVKLSSGTSLKVAANSAVLVVSTSKFISIYDLEDRHKNSVVVEHDGERTALSPGQHLTISTVDSNDFSDINPIEAIPHRAVRVSKKPDGKRIFASEFSLVAAMNSLQPVQQLMHSKHVHGARVAGNMLKTAAVVMQLRGNDEFLPYARAPLAAWKQ